MALTTSTKTLKIHKNSPQIRQKQSYIDATMSKFTEKNIFQNLSFFTILRLLSHLSSNQNIWWTDDDEQLKQTQYQTF